MSTPALRHHLLLHTMHAQGRRVHDGTGEMHEGATWRRLPQRLLSCPQTSAIDPSVDVLLLRQRQPVVGELKSDQPASWRSLYFIRRVVM